MQCFSFGSRKVSYTLLLGFTLSELCFACFASQTPGLCSAVPSAPVKFVKCLCSILLYSVIFFTLCVLPHKRLCNALPSAPVVCCTLLLLVIYVSCSLPHQHRACAVLFPSAPLKFTPFCFSFFYSVCFCYACFAQQAPVCAVIFLRLPSNLYAYFLLYIIQF